MQLKIHHQTLDNLRASHVFVLGDLILDAYITGQVSRISPEAPVPVMLEKERRYVLGGAANVAANIAAIGAQAVLAGAIGDDVNGKRFLDIAATLKISCEGVQTWKDFPTIRKLRILAGYQQLMRVDHEEPREATPADIERVMASFQKFAKNAGSSPALVISDYGKGFLTQAMLKTVIAEAQRLKIPVITDPKGLDYKRYSGSTLIKPNLKEARSFCAAKVFGKKFADVIDEAKTLSDIILEESNAQNVVLSLSEKGMFAKGKLLDSVIHYSSEALEVADVSGAGDTVVSFLAMGLAAKLEFPFIISLANKAAGIVCGKLGTATVDEEELLEALYQTNPSERFGKFSTLEELRKKREAWRKEGKRVVFTNGCFDLLHVGHIDLLRKAKLLGDVLIVALNSDASVKRLKGEHRPINSEEDRITVMSSLEIVDQVTLFSEDTPLHLIKALTPDVLVKGGDYQKETVVGASEVEAHGGRVVLIELVPGKSTTSMIARSKT